MSKTTPSQPPAIPVIPADQQAVRPHRRRFAEAFKRDTVRLVTHERYSFKAAAQAVGVSEKSLRTWHHKYAPPAPVCGPDAGVEQLRQENQRLRRELKRAELEREIFKKATACFAKESS